MKKLIFFIAAIALISLNNMAQVNKSDDNEDKKWDNDKTADFVKKVASSNEIEIQLAQKAQQKATSQEVKDFAQIEAKEHAEALQKLHAAYKNVPSTLENSDKNLIDNLSSESGKNFDKKYIDKMVDLHNDGLKDMEDAFSKVADPSLKSWISTTMLIENKHLSEATRIQQSLENKK